MKPLKKKQKTISVSLGLAMNFRYNIKGIVQKRKTDKLHFFKMKNVGSSNDTLKRMKRQYTCKSHI